MSRISLISLACSLFFISACSNNVTVSSDYNRQVDFTAFKTFAWRAPNEYNEKSESFLNNDILDERIRSNVNQQLQSQGLQLVEGNDVDFLVNYTISSEPQTDVRTYNTYQGFAPGWGLGGYYGNGLYPYYGVGLSYRVTGQETRVSHYQQGTFVLDIIDPQTDKLVWRGTAEGKIPENLSAAEKEAAVKDVVSRVLGNFPPKQG